MKKRKKKTGKSILRCPYCGRNARIHPASYVYGRDTLDTESYLYVTGIRIPATPMWGRTKTPCFPKGRWQTAV